MSFAKGFLFSCIIFMHVSFMDLRPLEGTLQEELDGIELSFCNLLNAEHKYVKLMFQKNLSEEHRSKSFKLPEGITLSLRNTTEIQASICAISDYLGNHLPNITRALTNSHEQIIDNTKDFLHQFKHAVKATLKGCTKKRELTTSDMFSLKMKGLSILYFSRRWLEHVTNRTISCDI